MLSHGKFGGWLSTHIMLIQSSQLYLQDPPKSADIDGAHYLLAEPWLPITLNLWQLVVGTKGLEFPLLSYQVGAPLPPTPTFSVSKLNEE